MQHTPCDSDPLIRRRALGRRRHSMLPTPSRGQHGTAQCASSKLRRRTLRWDMRAGASRRRPHVAASSPTRQDILSSALVVDNLRPEVTSATALGNWERVSTKGPVHKVRRAAELQPPNFRHIPARAIGRPYEMARASNRLDNNAPAQSCGGRMLASSVQFW